MTLCIPPLSILRPLTRTAVQGLRDAQRDGRPVLSGSCSVYSTMADWSGYDDDAVLSALMQAGGRNHRIFIMKLADLPGPYFGVYFYHPDLTARLREILRNADVDASLELTPGEDGIHVLVKRTFMSGEYSFTIPYADEIFPEKGGGSPVHDLEFTFRAVASIYAWVQLMWEVVDPSPSESTEGFGCYCGVSYASGLVGFFCGRFIRVAVDLQRWPEMACKETDKIQSITSSGSISRI